MPLLLGPRAITYRVSNLPKAKAWYSAVLGLEPYFDEAYYVGFEAAGFELGLVPREGQDEGDAARPSGATAYWGVRNVSDAVNHLTWNGAVLHEPVREVGDGIRQATVLDPFGNVFGVVEHPRFGQRGAAWRD